MPLLLEKLKQVRRQGNKTLAQCPACAETGHDAEGDHLVIYAQGHFACVVNPGPNGKAHRGRIFQLAGDNTPREIAVRPISRKPTGTPQRAVLGRLGRVVATRSESPTQPKHFSTESVLGVPTVPRDEKSASAGRLGRVPPSLAYGDNSPSIYKESILPVPSVPQKKRPRFRYPTSPEDAAAASSLSTWLSNVTLPESFSLSAWERVIQAEAFRSRLLLDLTCHNSAVFAPALDRARRVHALFNQEYSHAAN